MGFSLKRALAGAVVGGAHAAGEVFDAQLKEAALERERQQQFERQKELQIHQADLVMDRENRRDELKAARADKEQEKIGKNMSEIRSAVREKGLDPDKIDGLRYAAGLADEKGYTSIADKYRVRLETERSHLANEENKKLQRIALSEGRASRKREEMDAEERNAMIGLERLASKMVINKYDPETHKELPEERDTSAADAAMSWVYDQRDKKRSFKEIRSELSDVVSKVGKVRRDPKLGKLPGHAQFDTVMGFKANPEAPDQTESTSVQGTAGADVSSTKKPDSGGGAWGWLNDQLSTPGGNTSYQNSKGAW